MASMTDQAVINAALAQIANGTVFTTSITLAYPLHLRLMGTLAASNANGTNGTEITAATGYTAGGASLGSSPAFSSPAGGQATNSNAVSWTAGNSWPTVNGVEIWDTSGTAKRVFCIVSGQSFTAITGVASGDTVQFAPASVTLNASAW